MADEVAFLAAKYGMPTAIDQYVAGLVEVATATQDPSVLDNVDLDQAARYRGRALGVPSVCIPDADAVKAKREMRAQQQEMAVQQAQEAELQQEAGKALAQRVAG